MDRVAVFVDAGYLFAQGAKELCGRKLERRFISLDYQAAAKQLTEFAEQVSGLPLLRIYWYDGTSIGPTPQHNTLADQPNIKVRLGFVNSMGEQKGVDSLIVTDMITLARNRAIASCVLLSGDEDIRVGVQQAQEYGVRVHLLGIKPVRGSQSLFLLREADSSHEWAEGDINSFLRCDQSQSTLVPPASPTDVGMSAGRSQGSVEDSLLRIARELAEEIALLDVSTMVDEIRVTNQRPRHIDARLLAMSRNAVGRALTTHEKTRCKGLPPRCVGGTIGHLRCAARLTSAPPESNAPSSSQPSTSAAKCAYPTKKAWLEPRNLVHLGAKLLRSDRIVGPPAEYNSRIYRAKGSSQRLGEQAGLLAPARWLQRPGTWRAMRGAICGTTPTSQLSYYEGHD